MAKIINNYRVFLNDGGYVIGVSTVDDDNYDYTGQLADFDEDLTDGWYRFVPGLEKGLGEFVIDQAKKNEILAAREAEARRPSQLERIEAQGVYTALITDTLLPEEENE